VQATELLSTVAELQPRNSRIEEEDPLVVFLIIVRLG
jgi:hypothetical protein